jgi:phosphatidylglycerophosphate synthase
MQSERNFCAMGKSLMREERQRKADVKREILNVPNIISFARLALLPLLYYLCLRNHRILFLVAFMIIMGSDTVDGYLARKLNQVTKLGQKLDMIADIPCMLSLAFFMHRLFPEVIKPNILMIKIAVGLLVIALGYSTIKFRKPVFVHNQLLRCGTLAAYFSVIAAYFIQTPYFVSLALLLIIFGFVEWLLMFFIFGEVNPDTRTIITLINKK